MRPSIAGAKHGYARTSKTLKDKQELIRLEVLRADPNSSVTDWVCSSCSIVTECTFRFTEDCRGPKCPLGY